MFPNLDVPVKIEQIKPRGRRSHNYDPGKYWYYIVTIILL